MRSIFGILVLLLVVSSCKPSEARKPVSVASGSFINESINRNKALSEKEEQLIQDIITKDTIQDYIVSEGGFWYRYTKKDTVSLVKPTYGDIVQFNYELTDFNGVQIYSEKELDTVTYTIDKEELFLGLREGLKLMKAEENVTFLFPSYQAYGYYGDDNRIGTNIPLIAHVKLHKIIKN